MPVGTNVNALAVDTVTNLARQEHDDEGIDLPALDEFGCWTDEVDRLVVTLTSVIDAPDVNNTGNRVRRSDFSKYWGGSQTGTRAYWASAPGTVIALT